MKSAKVVNLKHLLRAERLASLGDSTRNRILQKNYNAVVSMAPLTPEEKPILCTFPSYFGPPIREILTPWFLLFLYCRVGTGPPSILLPQGNHIDELPEILKKFKVLCLHPWHREPESVNAQTALAKINAVVKVASLLVQGFSYSSTPPDAIFLPFPVSEGEKLPDVDQSCMKIASLIQTELLLANSAGYIKMLPLEEDQQPCCPVSVHFGLPLFDLQLNKQICGQIKDHGLFTEASMAQHSLNSRLLALDLLEFIRTQ